MYEVLPDRTVGEARFGCLLGRTTVGIYQDRSQVGVPRSISLFLTATSNSGYAARYLAAGAGAHQRALSEQDYRRAVAYLYSQHLQRYRDRSG